jgi:hypothetical protein
MHERRCYVNAARIDSTHIIACGGYNNRERLTSAEILDVNRNVWTEVASMNVIRSDAHAVELDGRIYCVGGFDGHSCHRTVEVYDPVLNQWSMLDREMRDKRSGVSAISINGVILGIGGFSGRHRLSTAEFYDPREGIWHPISCLILSRLVDQTKKLIILLDRILASLSFDRIQSFLVAMMEAGLQKCVSDLIGEQTSG